MIRKEEPVKLNMSFEDAIDLALKTPVKKTKNFTNDELNLIAGQFYIFLYTVLVRNKVLNEDLDYNVSAKYVKFSYDKSGELIYKINEGFYEAINDKDKYLLNQHFASLVNEIIFK